MSSEQPATTPAPAPAHSKLPDSSDMITATLQKEYGSNGGITLRTFGGKLIISHITTETVVSTGLKRGFEVLTMNNVDCTILSESSAQKLLEGDEMVTFLVKEPASFNTPGKLVTTLMNKETQDSPVGMGIKVVNGQVCVGTIKLGSMALATDLKSGMIIKYINKFDCVGLNPNQAAMLLATAVGKLEIIAQVPGQAKNSSADDLSASITLGTEPEELGLELINITSVKTGKNLVVIKNIQKESPFFGSPLRVGLQITSVQNIDCTEAKASEVTMLLKDNALAGQNIMVLAKDCSEHRRAPGSFLTVVMTKESADTKLGVVMAVKGGKVFVKKIADGSLGSTSELEPGMWVHSINNVSLVGKTASEAAELLASAEGRIVFLCQTAGGSGLADPTRFVTSVMTKEGEDKVGLGLRRAGDQLVITKNTVGCLAADTDLEVGMAIIQINDVDMAGKSVKEAAEMLTSAEGQLTVLASRPERSPGSLVVASIEIPEVAEGEARPSIGLKMKSASNGSYYISGVNPGGLASATELREGMVLLSVNNVDCASKKTLKDVLVMFQQTSGNLNILAAVPGGKPLPASQLVTAVCVTGKKVPEGSIVYDEESGKIMVTDSGASGLMFGTALRAGMEILAINNVESTLFSKVGFQNLLDSKEKLLFLAKRQELVPDQLITETIHKETADAALGIGLRKINGKIFISSIKDGTLASTSKLLPGMELVSVDNEDCEGVSAVVIAKALKEAVGDITIVASTKEGGLSKLGDVSLVTAIVEKGEKDSKVGLTFVRKRGLLVITKIAEGSAAADTDLLVGMDVLSINNTDVSEMSSKEATNMLLEAEGNITILAKRPSLPPGSFVTAAIVKESGSPVGLKLVGLRGGGTMIKSVTPQSLASFTELEEGMVIRSINNVDTSKYGTKEVAELLKADVPSLTILAQTTKEVAMGRASFRSMRSLTSARSLGESISSGMSTSAEGLEGKTITTKSTTTSEDPAKSISPEDPAESKSAAESKMEETILIVTGGKKSSVTVRNVVDC